MSIKCGLCGGLLYIRAEGGSTEPCPRCQPSIEDELRSLNSALETRIGRLREALKSMPNRNGCFCIIAQGHVCTECVVRNALAADDLAGKGPEPRGDSEPS